MSERATQLKKGFEQFTKSHDKAKCNRFKKAVKDRFALHDIASIQKNGVVNLNSGDIYAWNGSDSFYILPDVKRKPVEVPLVLFTLEEFSIALG